MLIPTRAKDYIIADFGNLLVSNKFEQFNGEEVNNYSLVLSDMRIQFHIFTYINVFEYQQTYLEKLPPVQFFEILRFESILHNRLNQAHLYH